MKPSGPKVLVAMSGGVDSSVAAALLVRAGYEVVGCFMRLGSVGEELDELRPAEEVCTPGRLKIAHQGCCSVSDAADARAVAAELGIPLYVCNFKRDFGRIIDYFVDEYASGRTPNPCVRCNDWLKFGKLHDYARRMGCAFVASGHYARVDRDDAGRARLRRGVDHSKDQSYVLFGVGREQLEQMMLPIGEYQKPAVRELARQFGLPVFDKPDSQEICFVPDQDYASLVERRRPELAAAGAIVDGDGRALGRHGGQHRFTIGQRRGVGVALGRPVYVVDKDVESNTVVVGEHTHLLCTGCTAGEANWLSESPPREWSAVSIRYRYNGRAVDGRVRAIGPGAGPTPSGRTGRFEVEFDESQAAVAPGQAIVLYDGDTVAGGGWIEAVRRA